MDKLIGRAVKNRVTGGQGVVVSLDENGYFARVKIEIHKYSFPTYTITEWPVDDILVIS